MTERSRSESSTPLATIEEIQKRLRRSSSLQSRGDFRDPEESQPKASLAEVPMAREKGVAKRKLEDYLDPVLLAAICAKIGRSKEPEMKTKMKRRIGDFKWPVDELKVFMEDSSVENGSGCKAVDAVYLSSDADIAGGGGDGEICTPFQLFEQTALKQFKS